MTDRLPPAIAFVFALIVIYVLIGQYGAGASAQVRAIGQAIAGLILLYLALTNVGKVQGAAAAVPAALSRLFTPGRLPEPPNAHLGGV